MSWAATKVAANAAATATAAQATGSKQVDGSKHFGCNESNKPEFLHPCFSPASRPLLLQLIKTGQLRL
jgi:hypothetical protein